jgi:hypothetical protein
MFNSLIDHAKLRVSSATTKLVGRIIVGVLFLIAAGFGVAAIQIALIESVGAIMACIIMAAAFVLLALLVAVVVVLQQRHQDSRLRHTAQQSALMSGIMSASPAAIMGGARLARLVGRRAPLFMLGALAGGMLLARSSLSTAQDDAVDR